MPLNIDWQQILLHWMNLAILTGGLYFLLYKPVKDFMAKREAHYQELDRQADRKLEEAEALKAACQAKLEGAEAEIREARAKAQTAAQQSADAQIAQAQDQARQIVDKARQEAEQSREQALRASQRELRELAAAAAKKLAAKPGTDPFDQFLNLAEGGETHEGR